MRKPDDYRYVLAWNSLSGRRVPQIKQIQEQAAKESAPLDSLYKDGNKWVTLKNLPPHHVMRERMEMWFRYRGM